MRNIEKTLKGKVFIRNHIEKKLSSPTAARVWDRTHLELEMIYSSYRDVPKKVATHTGFFLNLWPPVSRKMFGEESGFKNVFYPCKKGEFRMDIIQCPYHKYLTELGCGELNTLFCDNDVYSYGNIPGLRFTRTKTIGAGDECCDFKMELIKK